MLNVFLTGQASMTLNQRGRAAEVKTLEDDISEAVTLPEMPENSVLVNLNHVHVAATDSDVSLTPKIVSVKEVEDCLGESVQEKPCKADSHQGPQCKNVSPSSLVVENDKSSVKEKKTVIQERAGAANLEKGSTKVSICK